MFIPTLLISSVWWVILVVIIVIMAIWGGMILFDNWRRSKYAMTISAKQFEEGKRKAQVIDLRNDNDFKKSHIMGARNIPYVMLRQRYGELRPDMPVFLYDEGETVSTHAAVFLHKHGYHRLYILKGGFADWDGRTKASKY